MRSLLCAAILAMGASALGGCFADGSVGYGGGVAVAGPNLVYVEPGVQVIADYDQPVFFSDNMYWRYDGGVWYSSRWHDRGWVTSYNVPVAVRHIDRPEGYVHYRGNGGYNNGNREVRDHRAYQPQPRAPEGGVRVRDDRHEAPPVREERHAAPVRDHREPAPQPTVRDHRH